MSNLSLNRRRSLNVFMAISILAGTSCSKALVAPNTSTVGQNEAVRVVDKNARKPAPVPTTSFTTYTIQAGNHSCDQSTIKSVKTSEMKFTVKFDESAIYTNVIANNQYDINKLYGFSEGFDNQYNSARIGWNWYNNALHLHAYVYNKGVRAYQEITTVPIGAEVNCSIKVSGSTYVFTANGIAVSMARGATTATASGYQQYPYFGGDEVAPQKITILIKNI